MDSLCLKAGIQGISPPVAVAGGLDFRTNHPSHVASSAVGRSSSSRNSPWGFSFMHPLKSLWPGRTRYDAVAVDGPILVDEKGDNNKDARPNGNWIAKILRAEEEQVKPGSESDAKFHRKFDVAGADDVENSGSDDDCDVCHVDDDDVNIELDRDSFSKLLRRVSLTEAKLYAKMAYLADLAYSVAQIKPENLLRRHGLRFITSSVKKKHDAFKTEKEKELLEDQEVKHDNEVSQSNGAKEDETNLNENEGNKNGGNGISTSPVYRVAASAASYLYSRSSNFIPFISSAQSDGYEVIERDGNTDAMNGEEVASLVSAKEEVKQAVADDLNSTHSSPCEWFVCDDDHSGTRFFVIQGSESLESWQANLLFEPAQFEGLDVPVHRGIYEAAKGMYEQILPEIQAHIKSRGVRAKFRFTGHSLGGSLSLLLNLMLLIRGEVPSYTLLPVITFGSPSVMCGGDCLLRTLGLPQSHVQSITLHRDIVPRAFSCKYPNHIAEFLKAINGNFRHHPCLNNQKLLYAPMGELFILQPDDKFSPSHHLLPAGSGLYLLTGAEKQIRTAQAVFLNTPHPLEILSDRAAYGSGGTVQRDHDMNSYMKSIRDVIHQELNRVRKSRRTRVWWPFVGGDGGVFVRRVAASGNGAQRQFNFAGMLRTGKESLERFSTLVASQHMHLVVVVLLPAQLLVLRVFSATHIC